MSGDVELNPGPSTYDKKDVVRSLAISILELRLHQFGLKPLDIAGAGDCFFRAGSHQSYVIFKATLQHVQMLYLGTYLH